VLVFSENNGLDSFQFLHAMREVKFQKHSGLDAAGRAPIRFSFEKLKNAS
jgi:hypothetical protein